MLRFPGKIPVSIHPFFWIIAFIVGWFSTQSLSGTVIWMAIILGSVLTHEFGHALTAVAFGQKAQVELVGFGGVTQRNGGKRLKLWQEFLIVLNGPLAGFCLAGIAWWAYLLLSLSYPGSSLVYALEITYTVNLFWTILNLFPIQPLDGGKLLSILLESIFGLKGTKIALFISLLIGAGVGILFFVFHNFLIGSIFMFFTFESYKSWKQSLAVTNEDQNFILQHLLKEAEQHLHAGHKEEALTAFKRIRQMAKSGVIYQAAAENSAQLLAEKGELKEAYEALTSFGKKLNLESLYLLHQLAYSQQKWQEAVDLGDLVYQSHPDYQVAMINAVSHSALGHIKPTINWIQCAIHEGIPNVRQALDKPEFDPVRTDPRFRSFLDELGT